MKGAQALPKDRLKVIHSHRHTGSGATDKVEERGKQES